MSDSEQEARAFIDSVRQKWRAATAAIKANEANGDDRVHVTFRLSSDQVATIKQAVDSSPTIAGIEHELNEVGCNRPINRFFEYFEKICARCDESIPERLRAPVFEILARELQANVNSMISIAPGSKGFTADLFYSATVHHGDFAQRLRHYHEQGVPSSHLYTTIPACTVNPWAHLDAEVARRAGVGQAACRS